MIGQTIAKFFDFQYRGHRHLASLKIRNFNGRSAIEGQCASYCQIFSKSVKRLRRYRDLTFFKMVAVRHLGIVGRVFGPGYLVVSIVRNLVGIDAVVVIIYDFQYFTH